MNYTSSGHRLPGVRHGATRTEKMRIEATASLAAWRFFTEFKKISTTMSKNKAIPSGRTRVRNAQATVAIRYSFLRQYHTVTRTKRTESDVSIPLAAQRTNQTFAENANVARKAMNLSRITSNAKR